MEMNTSNPDNWTESENKAFEVMLAAFYDYLSQDSFKYLNIIAAELGKSQEDVHAHYEELVRDVKAILSGAVELPDYKDYGNSSDSDDDDYDDTRGKNLFDPSLLPKVSAEPPRKRGSPWTVEEHRMFVNLLKEHERGDWRGIAKKMKTRTATQVASHAQKYFIRQEKAKQNNQRVFKRRSIHDITS